MGSSRAPEFDLPNVVAQGKSSKDHFVSIPLYRLPGVVMSFDQHQGSDGSDAENDEAFEEGLTTGVTPQKHRWIRKGRFLNPILEYIVTCDQQDIPENQWSLK